MKTITVIGYGSMANAIIKTLIGDYHIEVAVRDTNKVLPLKSFFNEQITITKLDKLNIENKTVILCTKPDTVEEISKQTKGRAYLFISILAGVTIETLSSHFSAQHTIRAIPNQAASTAKSLTTVTGTKLVENEVLAIFNSIGKTVWVKDERELDIATALGSSSIAYLALITEWLIEGGVKEGLDRETALEITKGLFEGYSSLLKTNNPEDIIRHTTSPNGTTEAGLKILDKDAVKDTFILTIAETFKRAQNISLEH